VPTPASTRVSTITIVPRVLPTANTKIDGGEGIVVHDSGGIVTNAPLASKPDHFIPESDLREMIANQRSQN